ncbi:hypothetical protein NSPZN2_100455 [Nitrospira defluvii]|jgi:hypothetical protein|uniref:Transposase n=1 Tax=Nitrospira defluvii TaxID=330214 RepID=A0ABM8R4W0_9BACT|nr:hypothetical protein NSPZN2_100455 [Nitrospira defluvii]
MVAYMLVAHKASFRLYDPVQDLKVERQSSLETDCLHSSRATRWGTMVKPALTGAWPPLTN